LEEYAFIAQALEETAAWLKEYRTEENATAYSEKGAADLLTRADIATQRRLVSLLEASFPQDGIVGEEEGFDAVPDDPDGRHWLIDPIDGTYNFVRGFFPAWGISLALCQNGVPQAAGIAFPGTEQIYLAQRGGGASCSNTPLAVSAIDEVGRSQLMMDFSTPAHRQAAVAGGSASILAAGQVRSPGCAVVSLSAVATGGAEAALDFGLNAWDCAAGMLLVEEAGGRVSRPDGSPIHLLDGRRGILASNGVLHQAFVELVGLSGTA
jgi:myo-inositol-1(or 4)-monophosphatase